MPFSSLPGLLGRTRKSAVGAAVALMLAALPAQLVAVERTVTDAFGRDVRVGSAERIVTLGPDVTEIAFALGVGDRIVGLDRSSRYPAEAAEKPNVGYRRSLSAEGLLALRPDLIIAAQDIGPPEVVDILKGLSIAVVFVPEDNSLQGIGRKIGLVAATLDRDGEELARSVKADFEAAARMAERVPEAARKKVLFLHGLARLTAAGDGTAADAIIGYAGATNPFDGVNGYKAASEEALLAMAPDTILMLGDGNGGPTPEEVFAVPALRNTPAAANRSLLVLDGPYMLGFGPRTAGAIRDLALALYPEYLAAGE
ncbi:ABC transporter substrate-binding protein [Mesorhizobium sp. YM1C-6-2]|uniref:heme/hemin ABC transporter substrate-binding protein n=1 Tax=Mesorhizobium sp. YM1C-6-2 TaxID=1827501 RepID=UPI000EF223D8|nr:ABC transporter substrate-binding protein [Mesorhizobium sp. YM1C-6-2]RLP23261.1 ABC transporter substrate-binding protein [Mesorhizobium sp. YM1C-6-2]